MLRMLEFFRKFARNLFVLLVLEWLVDVQLHAQAAARPPPAARSTHIMLSNAAAGLWLASMLHHTLHLKA